MGMDVCGKAPRSELGHYFCANSSGWPPLADYCCHVAPEICASCKHWHSNDGDGLTDTQSVALARILIASINNGFIDDYARRHELALEKLLKTKCCMCDGTGIRHSSARERAFLNLASEIVGHKPGLPAGGCIFCAGTGFNDHGGRFSIEIVARFAAFLMDCGGFRID
jgi:hypothetical protein